MWFAQIHNSDVTNWNTKAVSLKNKYNTSPPPDFEVFVWTGKVFTELSNK